MGITIHYSTRFRGSAVELRKHLDDLAQVARKLDFSDAGPVYTVSYATDFSTPDAHTPMVDGEIDSSYRWAKIQAEPRGPILWYDDSEDVRRQKERQLARLARRRPQMNGLVLSLWWGEGCEATNLCFVRHGKCRTWRGSSFTKTQYASDFVRAHVAVCTLLKAAERLGLVTQASDEGEYYETGDITRLVDASECNLRLVESMTRVLTERFGDQLAGAGLKAGELLTDYSREA